MEVQIQLNHEAANPSVGVIERMNHNELLIKFHCVIRGGVHGTSDQDRTGVPDRLFDFVRGRSREPLVMAKKTAPSPGSVAMRYLSKFERIPEKRY